MPKGKLVKASKHDQLPFKQFKPTHLAPQAFNAQGNIEKMKEVIQKFVDSDPVKNEVGECENFKKWLTIFDFESIPQKAIDELIEML